MAYTLRVLWDANQAKAATPARGGPQRFPISHSTSSSDSHSFDEKTLKHTDSRESDRENGQASSNTQGVTEKDFAQYMTDTPSATIKAMVSRLKS